MASTARDLRTTRSRASSLPSPGPTCALSRVAIGADEDEEDTADTVLVNIDRPWGTSFWCTTSGTTAARGQRLLWLGRRCVPALHSGGALWDVVCPGDALGEQRRYPQDYKQCAAMHPVDYEQFVSMVGVRPRGWARTLSVRRVVNRSQSEC